MDAEISNEYLMRDDTVLSLVMNSIFDGIYIADASREILFWNRGAEEITGYSAEEVKGKHCFDNILNHIDENGQPLCQTRCPMLTAITTGKDVRAKIYPLNKAKKRFPVMTHIAPLRNSAGEVIAAIEVFRDISKEEEFRLLQEKLNKLVQQYVSQTTYEEIQAQVASNGPGHVRMRDLTIFYLDIVGFTPISEKSSPAELVMLLNSIFGMCDVITREKHGDIDKFIGDALMAVFIDANDAVEAANKILTEALPHFNAHRIAHQQDPVRVRIGINSGRVVQGDVGTTDRKDLTVIGDVVNTAERIEGACEADSLLVSESTYARLRGELAERFAFAGELTVRGKGQPVRVFSREPHGIAEAEHFTKRSGQ